MFQEKPKYLKFSRVEECLHNLARTLKFEKLPEPLSIVSV